MPKVVVNPSLKGLKQSKGNGFHHLDESNKGFKKSIISDTVTLPVVDTAAGAKTAAGNLLVPAGAWIERIAIKVVQLQPEDNGNGGDISATEVTGWTVSGVSYVLGANIVVDQAGTLNAIHSYSVTTDSPASDLGALEPNIVGSSQTAITINYSTTGTADDQESTPAKIEVVAELCEPQF